MSDLSFANDLWDSFESVITRMTEGKTFCQDFFRFFVEISKITKEFGTKLAALTKNRGADTGTTNLAWLACLQEVENMANKTLKLADDITYRVYNPIEVHLRDTKKTKQKGKETGRRLSEKLVESVRTMNSAKSEYEKSMRIFDQSQAEHDRIAHLNDINALNKARKKIETDKKTADRAEAAYRKSVEKAKELETKMLDTELPRILSDFETIEKQRIGIVKTSLLSFTNSLLEFCPSISQNCESLLICVDNSDVDRDVHDFIEDKKTGKKKDAVRIEYEPYNPQYKTCMKEGAGGAGTPGISRSPSAATLHHSPSSSSIQTSSSSSSSSSSFSPSSSSSSSAAKKTSTDTRAAAPPAAAPASEPVIARCRCLFDYTAGQPTELSFQKDEIINVLYKDPSGWWKGEVNGRVGFFPSVDWTEEIFDSPPAASSPASFSAPTPVAIAPVPEPAPSGGFQPPANTFRCRALYSLSPEGPDELPLVAGETLYIESRSDGWFLGFNGQGMKGLFPSNFVVFDP